MPRTGFEPAIPATKGPQTQVLYRAAAGTGVTKFMINKLLAKKNMINKLLATEVGHQTSKIVVSGDRVFWTLTLRLCILYSMKESNFKILSVSLQNAMFSRFLLFIVVIVTR
jgi:hypothetical protein